MFSLSKKDYISDIWRDKPLLIGMIFFNVGVFWLFSAPAISLLFLSISLIISFLKNTKNPLKDNINNCLILIIVLMLISCLIFPLLNLSQEFKRDSVLDTSPLLGLFNWIPLFFSFLGFQSYLQDKKDRLFFGIALISGSIPILISGFGQYLFNWYGPLKFLNGLIIWYQRDNMNGMTSLFNNQNYAGCALATVWPFFFSSLFNKKNSNFNTLITIILNILIIFGVLFTHSRNALLSLIIGTFILLVPLRGKLFITGILSIFSVFMINFASQIILNLNFIPLNLLEKIKYENLINEPRLILWDSAIKYILERPLLGWGGNNFSSLWNQNNSIYYGHSHSAPLEIAIQYGLPTAVIISSLLIYIIQKSFRRIFLTDDNKIIYFGKDNHIDRAFFAATVILLFANTIDMLYFDLRISLLIWIFLAGLRNIISNDINKNQEP